MGVQVIHIPIEMVSHSLPFPFPFPIACFIPIPMGFPWDSHGIPIPIGNPILTHISSVDYVGLLFLAHPIDDRPHDRRTSHFEKFRMVISPQRDIRSIHVWFYRRVFVVGGSIGAISSWTKYNRNTRGAWQSQT